jgi:hypothetical protein
MAMATPQSSFEKSRPDLPPGMIKVFMSGCLIGNIKRLSRMAAADGLDEFDRTCLIISAFLTAAAAIEATIMDYASMKSASYYNDKFGKLCIWKKYEALRPGSKLQDDFPEVAKIWDARSALMHHEPDRKRSRYVGEILNVTEAAKAHHTLLAFEEDIFGGTFPENMRESATIQ